MQAESKYQDIHLLALQVKEGNQKAFIYYLISFGSLYTGILKVL